MKFLAILLGFGGYMLVYAAVANSGRFATEPWEGLFQDAYAGTSEQSGGSGGTSPLTPSTNPNNPLNQKGANAQPVRPRQVPKANNPLNQIGANANP